MTIRKLADKVAEQNGRSGFRGRIWAVLQAQKFIDMGACSSQIEALDYMAGL